MKSILIVDDHPVVLEGLAFVFDKAGYDVMKALTAGEALKLAESNKKKLYALVIDLTLRDDADGLLLIKKMRKANVKAPAVVYTMHEELWNISLLLESKVEGIVLKGESIEELLDAVNEVGEGGRFISPVFRERMEVLSESMGKLSAKEINIINLISNGENTLEISKKMCISSKTIEYYRSNIMKKLDARNMTQAIRNAVKLGIISCMTLISTNNINAQQPTQPKAVDLGLSVEWADRNLGAKSALESGGFYSFGETEEKEVYSWATYQHCDDGDMFMQHYLGDESISGTEYDVVKKTLGDGWRMPTLEEFEELLDNCNLDFFPENDITNAYVRISTTDSKYIEIPITGYMSNGRLVYENRETDLLSGTLETETEEEDGITYRINTPYVLGLATPNTSVIVQASAHLGYPIRPVYQGQSKTEIATSESTEETIYTIDGKKVTCEKTSLQPGIYIRVKGGKAEKYLK